MIVELYWCPYNTFVFFCACIHTDYNKIWNCCFVQNKVYLTLPEFFLFFFLYSPKIDLSPKMNLFFECCYAVFRTPFLLQLQKLQSFFFMPSDANENCTSSHNKFGDKLKFVKCLHCCLNLQTMSSSSTNKESEHESGKLMPSLFYATIANILNFHLLI